MTPSTPEWQVCDEPANYLQPAAVAASEGSTPPEALPWCDLCGGSHFRQLHAWPVGDFWNPATVPIAVWQCQGCELVFLYPVPTPQQLPDAGDWWSPQLRRFRRRLWLKRPWEKLRCAMLGDPKDRMLRATHRIVPGGRLLDVGCGQGQLLQCARKFFDCTGLEPSPLAAEVARGHGFPVVESTFEEAELPAEHFDVVFLDSVIEHVRSPRQVLEKVHAILRSEGVVVLRTPKFGGPAYLWHRGGWNGFRHGYHTFLFSGKTLGQYLRQTGFQVLRRPCRNRMLDDILVLWGSKVGSQAATSL